MKKLREKGSLRRGQRYGLGHGFFSQNFNFIVFVFGGSQVYLVELTLGSERDQCFARLTRKGVSLMRSYR